MYIRRLLSVLEVSAALLHSTARHFTIPQSSPSFHAHYAQTLLSHLSHSSHILSNNNNHNHDNPNHRSAHTLHSTVTLTLCMLLAYSVNPNNQSFYICCSRSPQTVQASREHVTASSPH